VLERLTFLFCGSWFANLHLAIRFLAEGWKERRILVNEAYEWRKMSVTAKLPNGQEATQAFFVIRVLRRQQDGTWKFARAIIAPCPQD